MNLAPIILFVYNRPWHTRQTVEALQKNELAKDSLLYIFSDGSKSDKDIDTVKEIREFIKTIDGFKEVYVKESETNNGLANSVISGVTQIINKHGKVIVLEDDLIASPTFLEYMNILLDKYESESDIFSVTGYNHPKKVMQIPWDYHYDIYFNPRACSWSWGTWKDRWKNVDWEIRDFEDFKKNKDSQKNFNLGGEDMSEMLINQMEGKIDSWAIRWCYHHFKKNAHCVYPVKSYINNIGHDGSGVHCGNSINRFENKNLNTKKDIEVPEKIELNKEIMDSFRKVYKESFIKKNIIKILKITKTYTIYRKIRYKL